MQGRALILASVLGIWAIFSFRRATHLGPCRPAGATEVEPYLDPPDFTTITRDERGAIIPTREFLMEKVDRNVIHGILRRVDLGKREFVIDALIEDQDTIDPARGYLLYKPKRFTVAWNDTTVFDNRQKYEEEQIEDFAQLRFLCPAELRPGSWLIVFSEGLKPVIQFDGFTAGRVLWQSSRYADGVGQDFAEHGLTP